ncbi:hypothetical protein [Pseudohongiella spirulinae]|uniref:SPOR domain-containing protein n=1 Tax=Pseudohongiella spirulinae TaxID=1249552 RepID=A0A0S2KFJ6_9GAMM|nr:hypothetical protein [Pseudohongiella spirulinae]ALO47104.1 hypothetical protein PS2015_2470 [Pseudohongiella spirulinae]
MRRAIVCLVAINLLVLLWHVIRPPSVVTGRVQEAGDELLLLAEMEAAQLKLRDRCWLAGPLAPGYRADMDEVWPVIDAGRWLIVERNGDQQSLHRVYIAPPESVPAGVFLTQLNDAIRDASYNIDSYLVAEGVLAGNVSLGLFADMANAERVHAQLEVLGYEPVIAAESRSVAYEWLQIWYQDLEVRARQLLLERFDAMALAITENLCETIAHQK